MDETKGEHEGARGAMDETQGGMKKEKSIST